MSYDLYFCVPDDRVPLTREQFLAHFDGRPWYQIEGDQAFYGNESTGVYFSFDYNAPEQREVERSAELEEDGEAPPNDGLKDAGVSFNINYFRPHTFGLEAEPEVRAFVEAFGLSVEDPQLEGMGRGGYVPDGFLRGWNTGNQFAYAALTHQTGDDADFDMSQFTSQMMPTDHIDAAWRWNRQRNDLQVWLGDDVFVPMIMFVHIDGRPRRVIVWGDAIAQAVPECVDYVLMVREQLAPKRWFRKPVSDMALLRYDQLAPVLALAQRSELDDAPSYHLFNHGYEPPAKLIEFFRAQPPFNEQLEGVGFDQVLNEELLTEVINKAQAKAAKREARDDPDTPTIDA